MSRKQDLLSWAKSIQRKAFPNLGRWAFFFSIMFLIVVALIAGNWNLGTWAVLLAILPMSCTVLVAIAILGHGLVKSIMQIRACPRCGRAWALRKTGLKRRSPLLWFFGAFKWWHEYKCRYCENTEWMVISFGVKKCPSCNKRGTILHINTNPGQYEHYRCVHCNYVIWQKHSNTEE